MSGKQVCWRNIYSQMRHIYIIKYGLLQIRTVIYEIILSSHTICY